jgi:hypothetical protein
MCPSVAGRRRKTVLPPGSIPAVGLASETPDAERHSSDPVQCMRCRYHAIATLVHCASAALRQCHTQCSTAHAQAPFNVWNDYVQIADARTQSSYNFSSQHVFTLLDSNGICQGPPSRDISHLPPLLFEMGPRVKNCTAHTGTAAACPAVDTFPQQDLHVMCYQ